MAYPDKSLLEQHLLGKCGKLLECFKFIIYLKEVIKRFLNISYIGRCTHSQTNHCATFIRLAKQVKISGGSCGVTRVERFD